MQFIHKRLSFIDKLLGLVEHPALTDRLLLRLLFFITIATGIFSLLSLNNNFSLVTPADGGTVSEGIVGIPRFVNPALALTRADQDTVALLYSGLLKINPEGDLVPDIAERIDVSEDGTSYHIFVKKDRVFHDGTPLTARDVLFTIDLMRNPDLKSPLRGNWSDVTIESLNEYEFTVTLTEPYTPFIENFTFGIMPAHLWSSLPIEQLPFSQYNTEPVGSGPFMIQKVYRDTAGLISGYLLRPSETANAQLGTIELKFFQNEDLLLTALLEGEIDATIYLSPEQLTNLPSDTYRIINEALPRVFGIFLNQNRSTALRDKAARAALSAAIDRTALINEALGGYGVPTNEPIVRAQHAVLLSDTVLTVASTTTPSQILENGGWRKNEQGIWEKRIGQEMQTLSVTMKTGNAALFETVATHIAESWRQLGVEVQVEQYEQTDLVQSVIRARDFQALLFGIDMNRQQDLYPFWHSSQKDDPGLNIAQYTNVTADRLLETARANQNEEERLGSQNEISRIITEETPAIFLFAPSVTYVTSNGLTLPPMKQLGRPADRFMNIEDWYARTDTVWPLFAHN